MCVFVHKIDCFLIEIIFVLSYPISTRMPLIDVVEVEVEQGIAMTGGNGGFSTEDLEDPNPEEGW